MIKFEKTEVFNFEGAIRGMRNPMNSWDMSDTKWVYFGDEELSDFIDCDDDNDGWFLVVGQNDLDLMKKLIKAGSDHRKFMRQILISVDITAPLYWWKEFDTYKVGTVANSCSTMHKIHEKEFTLEDFSCEHMTDGCIDVLGDVINELNYQREQFIETGNKKWWHNMIQLLPSSYEQKRTVTLNYEVLRNIATSRSNHKLDEWSVGFIGWIESLPYTKELILNV